MQDEVKARSEGPSGKSGKAMVPRGIALRDVGERSQSIKTQSDASKRSPKSASAQWRRGGEGSDHSAPLTRWPARPDAAAASEPGTSRTPARDRATDSLPMASSIETASALTDMSAEASDAEERAPKEEEDAPAAADAAPEADEAARRDCGRGGRWAESHGGGRGDMRPGRPTTKQCGLHIDKSETEHAPPRRRWKRRSARVCRSRGSIQTLPEHLGAPSLSHLYAVTDPMTYQYPASSPSCGRFPDPPLVPDRSPIVYRRHPRHREQTV